MHPHRRTSHSTATLRPASVRPVRSRAAAVLGCLVLALVVGHVALSNAAASAAWQLRDARADLVDARAAYDTAVARAGALEDHATLERLALQQGLVPAGDAVSVINPRPVAAR